MAEHYTTSIEQTEQLGAEFGNKLKAGDVIALFGEMGAGKTAFIRGMAIGMGLNAFVSSPTYALVHEYEGVLPLYHFDMYRINSWDDLFTTCFFDYLDSEGVIAVEWSENIETALPANAIRVKIMPGNKSNERCIVIMEEKKIENSCN